MEELKVTDKRFFEENEPFITNGRSRDLASKAIESLKANKTVKLVSDKTRGIGLHVKGQDGIVDPSSVILDFSEMYEIGNVPSVSSLAVKIMNCAKAYGMTKNITTRTRNTEFDYSSKVEFMLYDLSPDAPKAEIEKFIHDKIIPADIEVLSRKTGGLLVAECMVKVGKMTGKDFYKKIYAPYEENLRKNFHNLVDPIDFDDWYFHPENAYSDYRRLYAWRHAYNTYR